MNKHKTSVVSVNPLLSVGRVSPSGRNPTHNVQAHEDVGLRCANPTYRAGV